MELGFQLLDDLLALRRSLRALLKQARKDKVLTDKEATVLELRHLETKTLGEVGKELGVTRERVRQIEYKAAMLLRVRYQPF